MIKKGLLIFLLFTVTLADAETIRTDVLVIGGTESGTAAAIQSSRSKLKTLLIEAGPLLGGQIITGKGLITGNKDLPFGIWGEFRKAAVQYYHDNRNYGLTSDSSLHFEPYTGGAILQKTADTVKNLTVKLHTAYGTIIKDGTGWEVSIKQGEQTYTVKTRVLIDATPTSAAAKNITGAIHPTALLKFTMDDINDPYKQQTSLYRTAVALCSASPNNTFTIPFGIPLGALVIAGQDNLIVTGTAINAPGAVTEMLADPAVQMGIGQGAGAIAAYCAFYKTTTKGFNLRTVRIIQGELLDFKDYLLPFGDIPFADINIRAIQQIGATGLLQGRITKDARTGEVKMRFMPDSLVKTAELDAGLNEIYTRAFLWFNKTKPGLYFTTGDLLSFISEITLREPKVFQLDMQKQWQPVYKFTSNFDLKKPVTRREFAVLANKFLNPFARYVDITGRLVN